LKKKYQPKGWAEFTQWGWDDRPHTEWVVEDGLRGLLFFMLCVVVACVILATLIVL